MSTQRVLKGRKPAPTGKRRQPAAKVLRPTLFVEIFKPAPGAVFQDPGASQRIQMPLPAFGPGLAARPTYEMAHVVGDSMVPLLLEGDHLIMRKDRFARRDQVAVVKVRGKEPVVKFCKRRADGSEIELVSLNGQKFPPIRVRASEVESAMEVLAVVRVRA